MILAGDMNHGYYIFNMATEAISEWIYATSIFNIIKEDGNLIVYISGRTIYDFCWYRGEERTFQLTGENYYLNVTIGENINLSRLCIFMLVHGGRENLFVICLPETGHHDR